MQVKISVCLFAGLLTACGGSEEPAAPAIDAQVAVDTAPASASCEPEAELSFICGIVNGEDILPLGATPWVLVSGMNGSLSGSDINGKIHLVNRGDKTAEILFPGDNPVLQLDQDQYPECPGQLDVSDFSAHGLSLRKLAKGPEIYQLYMTSHGAREAIEVFEVDAFLKPTIRWVGCIPMPLTSWTNSVSILPDGGFMATQFYDPGRDTIGDVFAGKTTGHVFAWHPGQAVSVLAGTDLAGPNGIVVSDDGRFVFVAAFGTAEVVRFDLSSSPPGKEVVKLDIYPDNIRWSDNGSLLTAGNNTPDYCGGGGCGWSVVEITPYNLAATRIGGAGEDSAMGDASSAMSIGNEIWVGTYGGDRIAVLPRP